ncbi:MAG: DUF3365 domain-containing protein [Helicobacteraceae bacterium]|nr:DUF3365 domain-containing protein [Helicobacteraceae bacterium]
MGKKVHFINKLMIIVMLLWTLLLGLIAAYFIFENYNYADKLAKNEAVVSVKKDLALRTWGASHGGVYVPVTERTQPNSYLSHIPNRDINTHELGKFTLMNPAYILSQMMHDYSELYGTKGHITSKILMNPKNKPDAWETKALDSIEATRKPIFKKSFIDGKEYYRYLKPLVTEQACLKCHAFQGYKVGDIRGAVSVSIPMQKFYDNAFSHSLSEVMAIFFIYMIGIGFIIYGGRKAKDIVETKIKDYEQHIFSLVDIIEKRDSYTAGHTKRVAKYSVLIAKEMGFNQDKLDDIYRASMLHDIGKISTPDSILLKPGKLTRLEYDIIKEHVIVSYELLNKVDIYKNIAEVVRHHHEHYDGSGYPQGLSGDQIPILSQIMTVADAFDAMTTNRVYKARKSVDIAILELKEFSGKQFNTQIVEAATKALAHVEVEMSVTQRAQIKLEKERFSYFYKDQLSGAYNRDYLEFILAYNHNDEFNLRCIQVVYLHNFTQYNKEYGWNAGDKILKKFASALDSIGKENYVFRLYGDDFIVLNRDHFDIEAYRESLEDALKDTAITLSFKHFDIDELEVENIDDLEKLL